MLQQKWDASMPFPYHFGNYVKAKDEVIKVESIVYAPHMDVLTPHINLYPIDEIEGIPLTEEIVEMAGFEFYNYDEYDQVPEDEEQPDAKDLLFIKSYRKFLTQYVYFALQSTPSGNWCMFNCFVTSDNYDNEDLEVVICYLKYVHELQNIYEIVFSKQLHFSKIKKA